MNELPLEKPLRIFACSHCGCTMNTRQSDCPACSTAVDPVTAQAAADALSVLDQAISDASYIRIVLITVLGVVPTGWTWLAQMHVTPLVFIFWPQALQGIPATLYAAGLIMALGMCGVVPMCLRRWVRFAGLPSRDEDFLIARRRVIVSAAVAILILAAMTAITLALYSRWSMDRPLR